MKIAVISDIHGNMQALEAVLEDIKQEKCEKIFCLGDLAMAGPEPAKTIEKIKELFNSGYLELIQGNTDEMIGNCSSDIIKKTKEAFPIMGEALEDDCKIIPENLKQFLKNLPAQKELTVEGVKILLVHGSPRKNNENIEPNLSVEKVEEMIANTDADIIFCGHTHIPCGYQTNTKQTVVNDGSIGRPFTENAEACYVLADFKCNEFDIKHKFIAYDNQKASEILKKRCFKGAEKLAKMLISPKSRHM